MCELSYFAMGMMLVGAVGIFIDNQLGYGALFGGAILTFVSLMFTDGNCTGWLY